MLTKAQLCRMIVGLVDANDAELVDLDTVLHTDVCAPADRGAVRDIRDLINRLFADFDYLESPRFDVEAEGKSSVYLKMLCKRYSDPVRCTEWRRAYADALGNVLNDNVAYSLTKSSNHVSLDRLRELLIAIANPQSDQPR